MQITKAKRLALHFRIWQLGTGLKWNCTASEIATELDCAVATVKSYAKASNWPLKQPRRSSMAKNRTGIDNIIKNGGYEL